MLRSFARSASAEPFIGHYRAVDDAVSSMRELVGQGNGLVTLTMMATLESTSLAFIPYLEELARKRGSEDLQYTAIHGEADIAHAKQFVWAVEHEMKMYDNATRIVSSTIDTTCQYLDAIFL